MRDEWQEKEAKRVRIRRVVDTLIQKVEAAEEGQRDAVRAELHAKMQEHTRAEVAEIKARVRELYPEALKYWPDEP